MHPAHRYPSRGAAARVSQAPALHEAMLPPPARARGQGVFRGNPSKLQDIVRQVVGDLRLSMLHAATAVRLGGTSGKPSYFGTVLPIPQRLRNAAWQNADDAIDDGSTHAGNAPRHENKTSAGAGARPRFDARSLPQRPR